MNHQTVQPGDLVTVHFTGKNEADEIFATSVDSDPVEFTVGEGRLIPGLENGVIGMQVAEEHKFNVPPEEAFGKYREELATTVSRSAFPDAAPPEEGKELKVRAQNGKLVEARITQIDGDEVTIDANHPLAGQTLEMDVKMLAVQKSPVPA
jgi:peptidylprolyl isomerase